ncbi:DUF3085 domain-containing protein [Enterobacter sp. JMULE2]|uniref:DUF3085 domain-containing protein n=1 Tax=Enterobacter sp. JMULE2 TaxID=2518340 RepID=UPI00157600B8|nr:DUF3085 domain-containing protein [Enterobacter sp. JMULE2]NTZ41079.1 DUF3085 domain-containing protein [Enterobacter sp. JMULE2]
MGTLVFTTADVKKLLDELHSSTAFQATVDELSDASCFHDGLRRNAEGQTEDEAVRAGTIFDPSAKYIKPDALGPRVLLVNSNGVYLLTNAILPGSPASRGSLAYARGMDPRTDSGWHTASVATMGGDDGSMTIPVAWLEHVVGTGASELRVKVTETSVSLLCAEGP